MNERKSKKMSGLTISTKKMIIATLIITIISYIYACFWLDEQAVNFVEFGKILLGYYVEIDKVTNFDILVKFT